MEENMNSLREMVLSKNLEESVQGIERLVKVADNIADILIEAIKVSNDRFISSERVSLLFYNYLSKLKSCINSDDKDLRFWAASLIVHYNVKDNIAEKILLDAIRHDVLDKAYPATNILFRVKNSYVKSAILERLKDNSLTNQAKEFFKTKLQELR